VKRLEGRLGGFCSAVKGIGMVIPNQEATMDQPKVNRHAISGVSLAFIDST